mgnify:CR=1 FL=1
METPPTHTSRSAHLKSLKTFEKSRYVTSVESRSTTNLYWNSLHNLLQDAVGEVLKLREIVVGRIYSYSRIAEFLKRAVANDEAQTEKWREEIAFLLNPAGSGSSSSFTVPASLAELLSKSKTKSKARRPSTPAPNLIKTKSGKNLALNTTGQLDLRSKLSTGVLAHTISQHSVLADRYVECGRNLATNVLVPLEDIIVELCSKVATFGTVGTGLVEGLKRGESSVSKAFSDYESTIEAIIKTPPPPAEAKADDATPPFTFDDTTNPKVSDPFLPEMNYRVLVEIFQKSEKSAQATLANLFTEAKELEFKRRGNVQNLLGKFYSLNEDLFLSLSPVQVQAVKGLESEIERGEVEKDVMR